MKRRSAAHLALIAATAAGASRFLYSFLIAIKDLSDAHSALSWLRHNVTDDLTGTFLVAIGLVGWLFLRRNPQALTAEHIGDRAALVARRGYLKRLAPLLEAERRRVVGTGAYLRISLEELLLSERGVEVGRRYSSIDEVLSDGSRFLLLGEAGSGKSAVLARIADITRQRLAGALRLDDDAREPETRNDVPVPIPIRVTLPALVRALNLDVPSRHAPADSAEDRRGAFLRAVWQLTDPALRPQRVEVLREWLACDDVFWILDGLDEVPASSLARLVERLDEEILRVNVDVPVVIACRTAFLEANRSVLDKLTVFGRIVRAQPLSWQQIVEYADAVGAPRLIGILRADPALAQLAASPFILPLVAESSSEPLQPPSVEVQSAFDLRLEILHRYVRRAAAGSRFSEDQVHRWLGEAGCVLETSDRLPADGDYSRLPFQDFADSRTWLSTLAFVVLAVGVAFSLPNGAHSRWWVLLGLTTAPALIIGLVGAFAPLLRRKFLGSGLLEQYLSVAKTDPGETLGTGLRQALTPKTSGLRLLRKAVENIVSWIAVALMIEAGLGGLVASVRTIHPTPMFTAVAVVLLLMAPVKGGARLLVVRAVLVALLLLAGIRVPPVAAIALTVTAAGVVFYLTGLFRSVLLITGGLLIWLGTTFNGEVTAAYIGAAYSLAVMSIASSDTGNFVSRRVGATFYIGVVVALPVIVSAWLWGENVSYLLLCALASSAFFASTREWLGQNLPGYHLLYRLCIGPPIRLILWWQGRMPIKTKAFGEFCVHHRFWELVSNEISWHHSLWRDYFVASRILLADGAVGQVTGYGLMGQRLLLDVAEGSSPERQAKALSELTRLWSAEGVGEAFLASRRIWHVGMRSNGPGLLGHAVAALTALRQTASALSQGIPHNFQHMVLSLDLGDLLLEQGKLAEASAVLAEGALIADYWAHDERLPTLADAYARLPGAQKLLQPAPEMIMMLRLKHGLTRQRLGAYDEGSAIIESAVNAVRGHYGERDLRTLVAMSATIPSLVAHGDVERALEVGSNAAQYLQGHRGHVGALLSAAMTLRLLNRHTEAIHLCERAIEELQTTTTLAGVAFPFQAVTELARCLLALGQVDGAKDVLEQSLEGIVSRRGQQHPNAFILKCELGTVHRAEGDLARACSLGREAVAGLQECLGIDALAVVEARVELGITLRRSGDTDESRNILCEALATYNRLGIPSHPSAERSRAALSNQTDDGGPCIA